MNEPGFEPLFDGVSLTGWSAIPRHYGQLYPGGPGVLDVNTDFPRDYNSQADAHPAAWSVEDGAIVGRQQPEGSGYGGYLISDRGYGDFELRLEANPDWPADTGIMVRRRRDSWEGLQVLIDHRQSGSIGGFYGNGIGGFHAVPFALDARRAPDGTPIGLQLDDPATSVEPFTPEKRAMLTKSAQAEDFLAAVGRLERFPDPLRRRAGAYHRLGQRSSGGGNRPGEASGSPLRSRGGAGSARRPRAHRVRGPRQRRPSRAGPLGAQRPLPVASYPHQGALRCKPNMLEVPCDRQPSEPAALS